MDSKQKILNPEFLKIDDRSTSELINYIGKLSKEINYYDSNNNINGEFFEMFSNDESFLISEISKFETSELKSKRIKLIKHFDSDDNLNTKIDILLKYLDFTKYFFDTLNDWFKRSIDKKISLTNSDLNNQIESIIKTHASKLLFEFNSIITNINSSKVIQIVKLDVLNYNYSIWESKITNSEEFVLSNDKKLFVNTLFKKLILINNSLFKLITNVVNGSSKKLVNSLKKTDHNPHVGLLFSFLHLFKHLQNDINKLSKKHLDYYFLEILNQKKISTPPNKTFGVFSIDQNIIETKINKGEKINSGQYEDGSVIKYELDDDLTLNNAKLSFLMTIFLSTSSLYDFNSRYRLISSVFSKVICSDISEIDKFNNDLNYFNALGVDQNFISDDEVNMDFAEIGFLLGSPVFKLGKSKRDILIDFVFDDSSVRHLSDLIIDISNNTNLSEDEVFFKIFSDSFIISYTSEIGWETIDSYQIMMPEDWTSNKLSLELKLTKSNSAFDNFDGELHNYNLIMESPVLRFQINQKKFYNVFAFLNKMKFEEIKIKSNVYNLKDLKIFRDGQSIQNSNEFEIFGSNPKQNSALFIGCEELFNKRVIDFNLNWKYSNLEEIEHNLKEYYNGYGKSFSENLFRLKISFLSDFNYVFKSNDNYNFQMFDSKNDTIENSKSHNFNSLNKTEISPNFNLSNNYIDVFSNDYETGLIKLQLDCPSYAFGHRMYPKVYASSVTNSISNKQDTNPESIINEPFSPMISDISIDYSAESILYFNENNRKENDFSEKNSFFHISPYGVKKTFSKEFINKSMFDNLINEGELILGFQSSDNLKNLDIFFEIVKNENENYDFSSKIEWYYTSKEEWKLLTNQNILNDQTNNLLNSGVISFLFPNDFSPSNHILNNDEFYIKAVSKNRADQFGLIKSIYTNSASVTELIPENENLRLTQLKSGSFQELENKIDGIISISQPVDSPKISLSENHNEYYKRISNLLKHKNRPVTKSDFEQFLLNNFNFLSYVRCVSNLDNKLSMICMKKIEKHQHVDEVKLSSSQISEISSFLNKYISPQFSFEIINPIFEDMWIKCSILFKDLNPGRAIELLNKDLLEFICPWKNSNLIDNISLKINNIDILNFLKNRNYIKYITGFSVIHFSKKSGGRIKIYDSALENYDNDFIESGSEKSIIVPRNIHRIKVIDLIEYEKPKEIDFSDLEIDKSFIVEKGIDIENKNNKMNSGEEEFTNLQFIIK